jgi:sporulation and spore germination protein
VSRLAIVKERYGQRRPSGYRRRVLVLALALALLGAVAETAVGSVAPTREPSTGVATARVKVFFPRGNGGSCKRVFAVSRTVQAPAVLRGAMTALLRGPTVAERRKGYGGWFSARTAGKLRSVTLLDGVAHIDFRDFRRIIPGASSSCGSALLLAQLNRTALQFPTVHRALYSFNGSRTAFYEWLQLAPPNRRLGR